MRALGEGLGDGVEARGDGAEEGGALLAGKSGVDGEGFSGEGYGLVELVGSGRVVGGIEGLAGGGVDAVGGLAGGGAASAADEGKTCELHTNS